MQLGDKIALQACLSVSPICVLTRNPNLMIRKTDMQGCACPAVMEQTHCKLNLSIRLAEEPHLVLSQASSALLSTQPLAFPPPENPALGLPLLLVVYRGKFFFAAGHREVVEEEKEEK